MSTQQCEERLKEKGIRPTAARILVLRKLSELMRPASLSELEIELETLDRSTIFRSLSLLLEHHAIHAFEDGSGSEKYELIGIDDFADLHTHFYCEVCHETYCLKMINVPSVDLPEGFEIRSVNYTIKGICDKCSRK